MDKATAHLAGALLAAIREIEDGIRPQLEAITALRALMPSDEELGFTRKKSKSVPKAKVGAPVTRPCGCAGTTGRHRMGCKGQLVRSKGGGSPAGKPSKKLGGRCEECGKEGVLLQHHGPKKFAFHFAPDPCGRPCAAGWLGKLAPEDKADGVHSRERCPRCAKGPS